MLRSRLTLLLFAGLAAFCPDLMGEDADSVTRPGTGKPVCGLGQEFHAGRRSALRESLETGWVILRGLPPTRAYRRFEQAKTFWYFTGINAQNVTLLMNCETGDETLFLPEQNPEQEAWDGEIWDAEDPWVSELTGISNIRKADELTAVLRESIEADDSVWIDQQPFTISGGALDRAQPFHSAQQRDPFDGRASREAAFAEKLEHLLELEPKDCSQQITEMRLIKQPEEMVALRRAADAGADGMVEAMRSSRPGLGEWQIEALMDFRHIQRGASAPAYSAIIGSGPNSCVLHYSDSSRRMHDGDILLIDYGPEADFYATDITRTWPVNGKFSDRQAAMYDVVAQAQQAGVDAARPGVTMRDIYDATNEVFEANDVRDHVRHMCCHFIGLDVHDLGGYSRELKPGMVLTVEPGLYFEDENLGIRIEDVIVITEEGCEVLTRGVPIDRSAIEALIAEKGLLDTATDE